MSRSSRRILNAMLIATALAAFGAVSPVAHAIFPYGKAPTASGVYDYASYLFILNGKITNGTTWSKGNDLPTNFDSDVWMLSDHRGTDLQIMYNPQELFGVKGMGVNRAWEISTGRPDVVVAVLDSGIRWEEDRKNLVNKYYLNRKELPIPQVGANPGALNPNDTRWGGYDINGDGVFNCKDYANDARVADLNGNGDIDPDDLIRTFSDGIDSDNNGYIDDISGWDFFENDNNPLDDTDYGHGTGEAINSTAEAGIAVATGCESCPGGGPKGDVGTCPNCMMMPLRVGDSFVADVNHFAEAVTYAVDNGASVVQEALGTLNRTSFGQSAIDYAYANGVIINASEADEAAPHHNWPAAYERTMVVNSIRNPSPPGMNPVGYLELNGCTNYGGYTFMSVPSIGCSSEATGVSSGISGLLMSAAKNAVERGKMTKYITDTGATAAYALSAAEAMQLWRLSCDDIDFSTPNPDHAFWSLWPKYKPLIGGPQGCTANNWNYTTTPFATRRYRTAKGWDYFTGYGRPNSARLLRYIGLEGVSGIADKEFVIDDWGPYGEGNDAALTAQDRIPPEIDVPSPRWWRQYPYDANMNLLLPDDPADPGMVVVKGRVAANRVTKAGGSYDYILEFAPHEQGLGYPAGLSQSAPDSEEKSAGPWTVVKRVNGLKKAFNGELGRISVAAMANALAQTPAPIAAADDPTSPYQPEKYAVRIRVRVIARPVKTADTINNEAVFQKQIDVYPAAEDVIRDDLGNGKRSCGGVGSPTFYDINGDGVDEMLLPSEDGFIHAYTDVATGTELPGWPVHTSLYPGIRTTGVNAYTKGKVMKTVYSSILFGSVAVADLFDKGDLQVLAADLEGRLYAWEVTGKARAKFPVTVDYNLSKQPPCGPATIPNCDDYTSPPRRDVYNARDWAFNSAPAIGDLDPTFNGLEIVIGSSDGHIYAFRNNGTLVPGWPVLLRDPAKVATMDPVSRAITYRSDANQEIGTKVVVTPSLGDINGDGRLDVVVGVNEQYSEPMNATANDSLLEQVVSLIGAPGNGRIYALYNTGSLTPETPASSATPHLQDQAYMPGWPVKIALINLDLLPYVGLGTNGQAALADFDGDGKLEIVCGTVMGPAYILRSDGSSFLGKDGSVYKTMNKGASEFGYYARNAANPTTDGTSFTALGGFAIGNMTRGPIISGPRPANWPVEHLTIASSAGGINRTLDILLEGKQLGSQDQLALWSPDGKYEPVAPLLVNDLQFFSSPTIADINGDGWAEVIQSTAASDTVAACYFNTNDTATRYYTGGWSMSSVALGNAPMGARSDGKLRLVTVTREGYLRLYPTPVVAGTPEAARALSEWPEFGHDPRNTGNYHVDAVRPYPLRDIEVTPLPGKKLQVKVTATGDDRYEGAAARYEVRYLAGTVAAPSWLSGKVLTLAANTPSPAGQQDTLVTTKVLPAVAAYTIVVRAFDEAGNGSVVAKAYVTSLP